MNYFKNYFIDVMVKRFFQLNGRASRKEFWFFILFSTIVSLVVGAIGSVLGIEYMVEMDTLQTVSDLTTSGESVVGFPINILQLVVGLIFMFPSFAITIRRLHDIGKSGWWQLIIFIPFIGIFILLVFCIMGSQKGTNQYG